MKTLEAISQNRVSIVGKLLDKSFATGTTTKGQPYERANITVRVTQTYGGKEEVSEVPVSMFATHYTNAGTVNPAYKSIQDLKEMHSAQEVGFEMADTIRLTGASIQENYFKSKTTGQMIFGWQIRGSFVSAGAAKVKDTASFTVDMFIRRMDREIDKDGIETNRLRINGAIVQYGGKVDVIDFIVENPESIDYLERNWQPGNTVTAQGRIRATVVEAVSCKSSSWGEDVPMDSTSSVRELIITTGDDNPKEEEFAYDPAEITKGLKRREADIEQMRLKSTNTAATANAKPTAARYEWQG